MQYTECTSKYTEYGKKMESVAQHCFEEHESRNHSAFSISSSGLVVNADEPYLGASLDGIVFCQCHGQGILEIKCPYKYKAGFDGFESDKDFPLESRFVMKSNHKYYYHMQLQMELTGCEFGYFYIFAGDKKEGLLCPVGKDQKFIDELKEILSSKFFGSILPEIVSRRLELKKTSKREVFCICKRPNLARWFYVQRKNAKLDGSTTPALE